MSVLTLKFVLNGGADVRRLRLNPAALTFAELTRAARDAAPGAVALSFRDDEDDTIAIKNDADWREALRVAHDQGRKSLKVFLTPTEATPTTPAVAAPTPTPDAGAAAAHASIYPTIPAAATPAPPTNTPAPTAQVPAPVERLAKNAFRFTTSMIFMAIFAPIAISLLFGFIRSLFGVVGCATCAFFKLIPLLMLGFAFRKMSRVFSGHSACARGSAGNGACGANSMPCMMWNRRRMKSGRCGRFRWNWAGDAENSSGGGRDAENSSAGAAAAAPVNPWARFSAPAAAAAAAPAAAAPAAAAPAAAAPAATAPSSSTPEISADSIKHIIAMGFDEADARAAIAARGSVMGALDALLGRVQ